LKACITVAIIGNVRLVLVASIFACGLFIKRQTFNSKAAGLGSTLLALACIGLIVPTIYYYHLVFPSFPQVEPDPHTVEYLSEEIAVILAAVYVLSLVFTLWTHQHLFAGPESEEESRREHEWSVGTALVVLLVATAAIAVMSEFLVGSVEHAAHELGMTEVFIGVIVVAVIGNAAEHSTAVMVAMKNEMDLAVTIAVGSSMQIALFVAPVLVFASLFIGPHPMDLHFTPMEVIAVLIAIAVTALVSQDGETHWMEGVLLLAVYLVLALAFYHLPETALGAGAAHG
jgi:Ca2+:H+ antiporter